MGNMGGKTSFFKSVRRIAASKQVVKLKVNGVAMVENMAYGSYFH